MARKSTQPGKPRKSTRAGNNKAAKTFLVSGRITDRRSGQGLPGLKVEAFDRDLQIEQPLSTAETDADGRYEIAYTAVQAGAAEKRGADLIVRILDQQGRLLGTSEVHYNAPAKTVIDLAVDLPPESEPSKSEATEPEPSEYEQLLAELKPLMKDVPLEGMQDADIDFLSKETGIPGTHIGMLRTAARNAPVLLAPPELLYGLLRKDMGGTLEELADHGREQLFMAVREAISEGIIGEVEGVALDRLLGRVAQARAGQDPLTKILEVSKVEGASRALKFLGGKGVSSLGELRSAEGFEAMETLEREQPGPAVDLLRGHVNLSVLAPEAQVRSILLDQGYHTVKQVVSSTVEEFAESTKDKLDPYTAVTLHTQAVVMDRIIKKHRLEAQIEGTTTGTKPAADGSPIMMKILFDSNNSCVCEDCESAVSPLAYLADLLKYCYDNLRDTGKPAGQQRVDYARLGLELHQKFADLPAECDAVEEQVHQVRIAIEVLRSYLAAHPSAANAATALAVEERDYLRATYEALLVRIGTSYADLRLAAVAPAEVQRALAERIGVRAPVSGTNLLRDLLLDVSGMPLAPLESKLEELFGLQDTRRDPLAAKPAPKLLTWRRERLRDAWFGQDWPDDTPGRGVPFIDPDVIGPDDFRYTDTARGAFEVWARRRTWVDQQLTTLWQLTPAGGGSKFTAMLDEMYATAGTAALPAYPLRGGGFAPARAWPSATPRAAFLALSAVLGSGDQTSVAGIRDQLRVSFGLEVDAYNRLSALYEKEAAQRADPRNPAPTDAEIREFVSILVQARKRLHFNDWLNEEGAAQNSTDPDVNFQFGPRDFWISLTEPDAGTWPPVDPDQRTPWIDPDLVRVTGLPDSAVGSGARVLWEARRLALSQKRSDLAAARGQGFAQALTEALGATIPTGFTTWGAFLDDTLQKLGSSTQGDVTLARDRLNQTLFMAEDVFRRLMVIRAKDSSTDPTQKPLAVEYDEAELILLGVYKRRSFYPVWRSEERVGTAALRDWQALKIRLPGWRSSPESRAAWQSALRVRSNEALIDPDLVDDGHLSFPLSRIPTGAPTATAKPEELAARFWRDRKAELSVKLTAIKTAREAAAAGTDKGLSAALTAAGLSIGELGEVETLADAGKPVVRRLSQLGLDAEAFQYLRRIHQLITANQPVDAPEWTDVYSILVQVWKLRNGMAWRAAERTAAIVLGPDCFKLPQPETTRFPPPLPPEPPRWRASLVRRLAWEDRLRARIDQDAALEQALAQAVDAVEEATLPLLRDSLIRAVTLTGPGMVGLAQRAKVLGDRLLIELAGGGCAKTTRIAQAIETIQNLLFSIRTGQLLDTYPTWGLTREAGDVFDGVWAWLGSYPTWRAAMFVLLYPENLLVPNLRRERTPAFSGLLEDLRSAAQLSRRDATAATGKFVEYLRDICQLEITASPEVQSAYFDEGRAFPLSMIAPVRFLFGLGKQSRRLYWSLVYRGQTGEVQSSWKLFTQFRTDITRVLGASIYKIPDANVDKRYLYVFVATSENNEDAIYFARFDLRGEGRWSPAEAEQLDANGNKHFTAELIQTSESVPPAVRITPAAGAAFEKHLGVQGTASSATTQQPLATVQWGDSHKVSIASAVHERIWGGIALRKGSVAGAPHDLVAFKLATNQPGAVTANSYFGYVHLSRGLAPSGDVGAPQTWTVIRDFNDNARYSWAHWVFGYHTAGEIPLGCAIAVADVDGDGKDDLIITYVIPGVNANDDPIVNCMIGLGLNDDGTAGSWTGFRTLFSNAMRNSGPIAVTFLGRSGNQFRLLLAGAGGTNRNSLWLRRVSVSLTNNNRDLTVIEAKAYPGTIPSASAEVTGLGLAIADLDADGQRDLLLHYTETAGAASVKGFLRYAASIDADGFPAGPWGTPVAVDSKLYQQAIGASFMNPSSAGLAVGSLSGAPVRLDAVIATFPGPPLTLTDFQYLIAGGINLQFSPSTAQSINTARYKPSLIPPGVPASFDFQIGPGQAAALNRNAVWNTNSSKTRINQVLLEEAFVFAPLAIALQLQRSGDYLAALDWFRWIFDYTAPRAQRALYPGLEPNPGGPGIWRAGNWAWLRDPLDPHSIAQGRKGTYRRFILLAIIRCLLDYADAEFTRDTSESIALARTLYLTALELLDDGDVKQKYNYCDEIIDELVFIIGDLADPTSAGALEDLIPLFRGKLAAGDLMDITGPLKSAHKRGYMTAGEASIIHDVTERVKRPHEVSPRTLDQMFAGQQLLESRLNQAAVSDQVQLQEMTEAKATVERSLDSAVAIVFEKGREGYGTGAAAGPGGPAAGSFIPGGGYTDYVREHYERPPGGPGNGGDIFGGLLDRLPVDLNDFPWKYEFEPQKVVIPEGSIKPGGFTPMPPMLSITTCVPPNPVLRALRLRAELNLYKLRTCRSITGELQQVEPYAAAADTRSGIPSIGSGGQLVLPGLAALAPTPYRYTVLIERARGLVQLAQQVESAMLAALQAGDTERYNAFKARQDLESARANVELQSLRIHEAESGITLTQLQQERAQLEIDQYNAWLFAGLSQLEEASLMIQGLGVAHLHVQAAINEAMTWGIGGIGDVGNALIATASLMQNIASFERRAEQWAFQRNMAQQDLKIAAQQFYIAQDQLRVVTQEQAIASLIEDHSSATIEFLARKFTNTDLYDWMADVLSGVYRYFLQQAAGMARLAGSQLAFERQTAPPPFIRADYWTPPSDQGGDSSDDRAPDRRGLTGSVRLLQDITQLDQYAFTSDVRKLQLSKTISVAQTSPLEFQRFRETGVLTFGTPLEMFDGDFPGHYLRLVHRVKVSLIALTPPATGIRATLTSNRISRVVIGGDLYQTVRVSRGPDMAALSSPRDATGLFELDIQPSMLAPFENIGVDTTWELRMPRAANPFDFASIADVLFTIQYTALHSYDYQQQVLQRLNARASARRGWSFRYHLADQWYDLHNPDLTPTPMKVQFVTAKEDFPANLIPDSLTIEDVALHFVRKDGARFELPNVRLRFQETSTAGFVGGAAGTLDGTISTSSGAAGSWSTMRTKAPIGTWELSLPDSSEIRSRFASGDIQDILLVIAYSGRIPEWPA